MFKLKKEKKVESIKNENSLQARLNRWHEKYDRSHMDPIPYYNYAYAARDEEIIEEGLLDMSDKEIKEWVSGKVANLICAQKEEYMEKKAGPVLWALEKFFKDKIVQVQKK